MCTTMKPLPAPSERPTAKPPRAGLRVLAMCLITAGSVAVTTAAAATAACCACVTVARRARRHGAAPRTPCRTISTLKRIPTSTPTTTAAASAATVDIAGCCKVHSVAPW